MNRQKTDSHVTVNTFLFTLSPPRNKNLGVVSLQSWEDGAISCIKIRSRSLGKRESSIMQYC